MKASVECSIGVAKSVELGVQTPVPAEELQARLAEHLYFAFEVPGQIGVLPSPPQRGRRLRRPFAPQALLSHRLEKWVPHDLEEGRIGLEAQEQTAGAFCFAPFRPP